MSNKAKTRSLMRRYQGFFHVEIVTFIGIGFRASEPPTNKQGIQTNAELFVIQNMVV